MIFTGMPTMCLYFMRSAFASLTRDQSPGLDRRCAPDLWQCGGDLLSAHIIAIRKAHGRKPESLPQPNDTSIQTAQFHNTVFLFSSIL